MAVATAGTLSLSLTLTDKITAPLAKVNAFADRMTRQANMLAGPSGFGRLTAAAQRVSGSIAAIAPPLGALTAIGSVAGVVRLADSFGRLGATLGRSAYRVQASVTGLSTLQGAARLAGTSAEDLTAGLQGLGDAVIDAVGGRDSNAWQYFSLLGVSMRDASGNARTASDVLPDVADGLARIGDPRLQARVMGALRLPESMLPFLRKGAAGIREYRAEVERYGAAMTPRQVEIAQRFEMSQARVSLAFQGLSNRITERLAPVLGGLLDRLAAWAANDDLTARIGKIGDAFEKWVASGGVDSLVAKITAFGEGINKTVEWMGGWEVAAKTLGVALAVNMVAPLAGIAASLAVITAFKAPGWMLRSTPAMLPLLGVGAAGGEDPEFSEQANERYLQRRRERQEQDPATSDDDQQSFLDRLSDLFRQRLAPALGRAGWQFRADRPAIPTDGSAPRGIRNNNPLNLSYVPGQEGLDPGQPSDGRFGRYSSMEAGIAQSVRQMQRHAERRGDDTIAKLVARWAPPNENDTAGYIDRVSRDTGIAAGDRLDLRDADTLRRLVTSMARVETGRALDPATVQRGVGLGLGHPVALPAPAAPPGPPIRLQLPDRPGSAPAEGAAPGPQSQRVDVRVQLAGAVPPGTTVTTRTQDGGVRVERSMLGSQP